jgi:hypothetical protein
LENWVIDMSLTTLTFGDRTSRDSGHDFRTIDLSRPMENVEVAPSVENKLKVIKICQFYKCQYVYILGEVMNGVVGESMKGRTGEKAFLVESIESKYPGARAVKKGVRVGLMVSGIEKEDVSEGATLDFYA